MVKAIKSFGLSPEVVTELDDWKSKSPFSQSILVDMLLRDYFGLTNQGVILSEHKTTAVQKIVKKEVDQIESEAKKEIGEQVEDKTVTKENLVGNWLEHIISSIAIRCEKGVDGGRAYIITGIPLSGTLEEKAQIKSETLAMDNIFVSSSELLDMALEAISKRADELKDKWEKEEAIRNKGA